MRQYFRFSRKGKGKVIADPSGQAGPINGIDFIGIISLIVSVNKNFLIILLRFPIISVLIKKRKKDPGLIKNSRSFRH